MAWKALRQYAFCEHTGMLVRSNCCWWDEHDVHATFFGTVVGDMGPVDYPAAPMGGKNVAVSTH